MDFENKKIIVAGASGGIGGATCEALAAEGAVVIMIGRSEEKLRNQMEKLNGTGHRCYLCDLGIVDSIEPCISQIIEECGAVDGFVHSAGVGDVRPLKMSKYDFMLRIMNINFFSYVEIVRCITKRGAYKEGLSIVGISSVGAQYGRQSRTAYSASKGAMDASMRTMAKELGVKGIRVNNIAPGGTRSSMTDDFDAYLKGIIEKLDYEKSSDVDKYDPKMFFVPVEPTTAAEESSDDSSEEDGAADDAESSAEE